MFAAEDPSQNWPRTRPALNPHRGVSASSGSQRKLRHLPLPGRRPAAAGTGEDQPGRRCGRSRLAGRRLDQHPLASRAGGL